MFFWKFENWVWIINFLVFWALFLAILLQQTVFYARIDLFISNSDVIMLIYANYRSRPNSRVQHSHVQDNWTSNCHIPSTMARLGERRSFAKHEHKLLNLIYNAVNMENGKGVSRQKIIQRVQKASKSQKNIENNAKMAIMKALDNGMLIRTSGSGLNGSFRLLSDTNSQIFSFTKKLFEADSSSNENTENRLYKKTATVYNTPVFSVSNGLTEPFQLKAILKAPRSNTASGYHVRFSGRSPKIFWISPRPNKRRQRRRFATWAVGNILLCATNLIEKPLKIFTSFKMIASLFEFVFKRIYEVLPFFLEFFLSIYDKLVCCCCCADHSTVHAYVWVTAAHIAFWKGWMKNEWKESMK